MQKRLVIGLGDVVNFVFRCTRCDTEVRYPVVKPQFENESVRPRSIPSGCPICDYEFSEPVREVTYQPSTLFIRMFRELQSSDADRAIEILLEVDADTVNEETQT